MSDIEYYYNSFKKILTLFKSTDLKKCSFSSDFSQVIEFNRDLDNESYEIPYIEITEKLPSNNFWNEVKLIKNEEISSCIQIIQEDNYIFKIKFIDSYETFMSNFIEYQNELPYIKNKEIKEIKDKKYDKKYILEYIDEEEDNIKVYFSYIENIKYIKKSKYLNTKKVYFNSEENKISESDNLKGNWDKVIIVDKFFGKNIQIIHESFYPDKKYLHFVDDFESSKKNALKYFISENKISKYDIDIYCNMITISTEYKFNKIISIYYENVKIE